MTITMFNICKIYPIWIPPSYPDEITKLISNTNKFAQSGYNLGKACSEVEKAMVQLGASIEGLTKYLDKFVDNYIEDEIENEVYKENT